MGARTSLRTRGFPAQTISTAGGAVTIPVRRGASGDVLITITTTNEVNTASLQMAVNGYSGLGASVAYVASLTAAVTTNSTTHYLFGASSATEEGPITEAFLNRLPENFDIVLTVTGASASFDVAVGVAFL